MRCGYIRWIWDCGNTREVEEKHTGRYGARGQKRQKRRKATPEEIAKQNQWKRERDVRRLIKWNFGIGDYWFTLTYKKGSRPPWKQMQKDMSKFIRKLRDRYKKYGWELKYIYRLEIGKQGGPHVHILVNRKSNNETDTGLLVEQLHLEPWYSRIPEHLNVYSPMEKHPSQPYEVSNSPEVLKEKTIFLWVLPCHST